VQRCRLRAALSAVAVRQPLVVNPVDWRVELERLHAMSFAWALYCCRQRREEAQDVLQEVYLRVLDGRAQFGGQASVKTWLFAVIRLTARERARRGWLRAALLERWFESEPAEESLSGPETAMGDTESSARLLEALARLSKRQQEVLHLVFYQDATIEESATMLGISLGSARTHFERGKARLREHLREHAYEGPSR
jgi:RNA polymerase sigma-70 factor (ECF subfamily)